MYYETDDLKGKRVYFKHQKSYRIFVLNKHTGKIAKGSNVGWNRNRSVKSHVDFMQDELDELKIVSGELRLVCTMKYNPKSKRSGAIIGEVQLDIVRRLGEKETAFITLEAMKRALINSSDLELACRTVLDSFIERDSIPYDEVEISTSHESVTELTGDKTSAMLLFRGREYQQPNVTFETIIDAELVDVL